MPALPEPEPEMPAGYVAWDYRHHRLFLGRTLSHIMKAEEHQCIPTLSDIQGLLEQNAPFLSSVQKRETFPHVSVKFFRSNNGQWEIKKKKKFEGRGSESAMEDCPDSQGHVLR